MAEVTAYAPGSASNLGPGFDCLGVAFTGKGDRVTARVTATAGVRVESTSDPRIPLQADRNTAGIAAAAVLRRAGGSAGLALRVQKGLPLAGGMGGSAASAVAGAVAADAALGLRLQKQELLEAALEAETAVAGRHADNVAPSLFGGAVLVLGLDPPRLVRLRVHPELRLVLVTPDYAVMTAEARAVLPVQVPRGDAVAQAASLGVLVVALERGDRELIRPAMVDRIAEPVRWRLYPGYVQARAAALEAGAIAVVVSGAGPTLVAMAAVAEAAAVAQALEIGYARAEIKAQAHVAEVDVTGARVEP